MEGSKQEVESSAPRVPEIVSQPGQWGKTLAYSEIKQYLTTPEDAERFLISFEKSLMGSLGVNPEESDNPAVTEILRLFLLRETFSFLDEDGTDYVWDVTGAKEIITAIPREAALFSPGEHGITAEHIVSRYPGFDPARAENADLSVPVIFIPFMGAHLLIDGWHRLYRAVTEGIEVLPGYVLEEHEAELILASRTTKGGTPA